MSEPQTFKVSSRDIDKVLLTKECLVTEPKKTLVAVWDHHDLTPLTRLAEALCNCPLLRLSFIRCFIGIAPSRITETRVEASNFTKKKSFGTLLKMNHSHVKS